MLKFSDFSFTAPSFKAHIQIQYFYHIVLLNFLLVKYYNFIYNLYNKIVNIILIQTMTSALKCQGLAYLRSSTLKHFLELYKELLLN